MKTKQFLAYIENEKRYSTHTVDSYSNDLKQFFQYLTDCYEIEAENEIQHTHIRSWLVDLVSEQQLTSKSIHRKLSTLKSYFKFLKNQAFIAHNPCLKVDAPKVSSRLPKSVEDKFLKDLLEEMKAAEDWRTYRDYLIVKVLYLTGMRRAELIKLEESDLDLSRSVLKLSGKGNKERMIPISNTLKSELVDYMEMKRAEFVDQNRLFITNAGKALYPNYIYRLVKKSLALVTNSKHRYPHILRHSFATNLLNEGADLNAIKELLGHASLASTQVYTHNSFEKLKKIYKQAHPKSQA